jgi:RNA polymerase sigma-70 factor, ECF subfamily
MHRQSLSYSANFRRNLADSRCRVAPAELDDGQLIQATCRGDTAAFGSLVCKYQDRLCNSLTHVCGSLADAQDAAQEAFIRAYKKLDSFAGASGFYTWLYRIALNVSLSKTRKRRCEFSLERRFQATGAEPVDKLERPDARLLREERSLQVQRALASLSAEHRTILVLREIEDCDYDEISRILDLPVGTVRSRLHRARLQLKEQLELILADNRERN